jgi:signal transduction histidine kinase
MVERTPGGCRVLVIDDDEDEATSLRDALAIGGHEVVAALDGAAGLARARTFAPRVVICDLGLPRMSGLEVARAMRADPTLADVALVALTGHTGADSVAAARAAGFDHHVAKPPDVAALERLVRATGAAAGIPRRAPSVRGPEGAPSAEPPRAPGPRDRALQAFLSRAAHDLGAPLRHIGGFCDALVEDCAPALGDAGLRHVARIQGAREKAQALVEDLLTLWRVEHAAVRAEDVDLTALAREIAADLRRRDPGRTVDVEIAEGLRATGDPTFLRVILVQLLGNAWKYTSRQPAAHVAFGATGPPGDRELFVRDDGVGFESADAASLFEPFQRLHPQTQFDGTGLGLHVVRRAVERLGGRVRIEAAPGEGATVTFSLP